MVTCRPLLHKASGLDRENFRRTACPELHSRSSASRLLHRNVLLVPADVVSSFHEFAPELLANFVYSLPKADIDETSNVRRKLHGLLVENSHSATAELSQDHPKLQDHVLTSPIVPVFPPVCGPDRHRVWAWQLHVPEPRGRRVPGPGRGGALSPLVARGGGQEARRGGTPPFSPTRRSGSRSWPWIRPATGPTRRWW